MSFYITSERFSFLLELSVALSAFRSRSISGSCSVTTRGLDVTMDAEVTKVVTQVLSYERDDHSKDCKVNYIYGR